METLGKVFDQFEQHLDSKDCSIASVNSRHVYRSRISNLRRLLNVKREFRKVSHDDLQEYIYQRMEEHVSPVTVRKEIQTFVTIRNWKLDCGLTKGLDYGGNP